MKPAASRGRDAVVVAPRPLTPVWPVVLLLALFYLGAVYFDRHGGWFNAQVYAPYQNTGELALYQPRSGQAMLLAEGRNVYQNVCGVCHGNDGLGRPNQTPPLAGSDWVAKDAGVLAHIPLAGLSGPVEVKGVQWNLSMPPMGAALSDARLAAVLTYIRSSWGNRSSAISAAEVSQARARIGGNAPVPAGWAKMTTIERGRYVFVQYNCAQCHGSDGQGGVANPNAKTAEQVPSLIHVADGYTKAELKAFIMKGERDVPRLNPNGPAPPRFMPAWGGIIRDSDLNDLVDYLFSLKPKEQDLGF
ncbi:MAG: cytochrome c [Verrucomicrobiota bacterium]|nr:cytochrome c [Verrucomicrobiota bacterium]